MKFRLIFAMIIGGAALVSDSFAESVSKSADKKMDPREIRSTLFKYNSLLNKNHNALYYKILRGMDLQAIRGGKFRLAMCSIKCAPSSSKDNREMFVKAMIAVINCLNKIILEHRDFIKFVKRNQRTLTDEQKKRFDMICSFYRTKDLSELLKRVAPVPVSMAVAQAALESGFGSCRYLSARNGVFGMMKTKTQLVEFDTVFEAGIAYVKSLNVNRSYRHFREKRHILMAQSKKIDGAVLSGYIRRYSVNPAYQKHILSIMKTYRLYSFDQAYAEKV